MRPTAGAAPDVQRAAMQPIVCPPARHRLGSLGHDAVVDSSAAAIEHAFGHGGVRRPCASRRRHLASWRRRADRDRTRVQRLEQVFRERAKGVRLVRGIVHDLQQTFERVDARRRPLPFVDERERPDTAGDAADLRINPDHGDSQLGLPQQRQPASCRQQSGPASGRNSNAAQRQTAQRFSRGSQCQPRRAGFPGRRTCLVRVTLHFRSISKKRLNLHGGQVGFAAANMVVESALASASAARRPAAAT